MAPAERHAIAVLQRQGDVLGAGGGGQADRGAGGLVHQPAAGHMVSVGVGVEAGHQAEAQLLNQGQITIVLLEHRIDQHPLAAGHIGEQIGEGAGGRVEQLAKQQRRAAGGGREQRRGRSKGQESIPQSCYERMRIAGNWQGLAGPSRVEGQADLRPRICTTALSPW